ALKDMGDRLAENKQPADRPAGGGGGAQKFGADQNRDADQRDRVGPVDRLERRSLGQSRTPRSNSGKNTQNRHMWTASWQVFFDVLIALVSFGHMSGLSMRRYAAGPDDIRQPWSLSLRRARARDGWRGVLGFRWRPCRSSRL